MFSRLSDNLDNLDEDGRYQCAGSGPKNQLFFVTRVLNFTALFSSQREEYTAFRTKEVRYDFEMSLRKTQDRTALNLSIWRTRRLYPSQKLCCWEQTLCFRRDYKQQHTYDILYNNNRQHDSYRKFIKRRFVASPGSGALL